MKSDIGVLAENSEDFYSKVGDERYKILVSRNLNPKK